MFKVYLNLSFKVLVSFSIIRALNQERSFKEWMREKEVQSLIQVGLISHVSFALQHLLPDSGTKHGLLITSLIASHSLFLSILLAQQSDRIIQLSLHITLLLTTILLFWSHYTSYNFSRDGILTVGFIIAIVFLLHNSARSILIPLWHRTRQLPLCYGYKICMDRT